VCLLIILLSLCPNSWIPVRLSQRCSLHVIRIFDADMLACITKDLISQTTLNVHPGSASRHALLIEASHALEVVVAKVVVVCLGASKVMTTDRVSTRKMPPRSLTRWAGTRATCRGQSLPKYARERTWQAKVFNVCRFPFAINN
jgi:hypothetical protein